MQNLTIIKVGGAIVEDKSRLNEFLDRFAQIDGCKVLVHGGGRRATKVASALGIETKMVDGRRITDANMLEVVTMVYGGLVNKNIVAQLQARGINALGLTGADMNVMLGHRRPLRNGIDYGFVGDVDFTDGQQLASLLEHQLTPVIAPLTHDGNGSLLNTNADTIASETAKALAPFFDVSLIFCLEKPGVLANPEDTGSIIPVITRSDFSKLTAEGIISGGMKPKIENALIAVEAGVKRVIITKAEYLGTDRGTVVRC